MINPIGQTSGVHSASAYKLAQQGRIPCQKVGRHWGFGREAIDAWLDASNSGSMEQQLQARA